MKVSRKVQSVEKAATLKLELRARQEVTKRPNLKHPRRPRASGKISLLTSRNSGNISSFLLYHLPYISKSVWSTFCSLNRSIALVFRALLVFGPFTLKLFALSHGYGLDQSHSRRVVVLDTPFGSSIPERPRNSPLNSRCAPCLAERRTRFLLNSRSFRKRTGHRYDCVDVWCSIVCKHAIDLPCMPNLQQGVSKHTQKNPRLTV